MTSALASADLNLPTFEFGSGVSTTGAQTLLVPKPARPAYMIQGAAILLYALALGAALTLRSAPPEPATEEPLELVMLPPVVEPIAEPEPPPEEAIPEPIEEALPEPPPPVAEEPAVAPVEPKPIPPRKKEKVVERKPPVERPRRAAESAPPRPGPTNVPPNAMPSGYANQVHARIARVAGSNYPRAALARHETGRVGYRIVIGPSGELLSKNISPSGNPTFDGAAAEALSRAAPFPATGMNRPVSLSGAIAYQTR